MNLGYLCLAGEGETDLVLQQVARLLAARGVVTAGAVQINTAREGRAKPDMDLFLLPDGPLIRISVQRGEAAAGCRLDTAALEEAAVIVAQRLAGADVLIVNKFGQQEATGHGLADSIAAALAAGKPVLTGTAEHFLQGFLAWAEGHETALPADAGAIADWVSQARAGRDPGRLTGKC
ncbi:DUF2478 domain-containing protein [Pseudogemmobacter humi]|uniref:ABC-type molybdate transport system, ATPase component n=1 Tax=Pseudogemmobacter humi TaxID=2483812 RepID=A0A3P5XQF7_9RHOB|nr:DUF2478 domain-containing protein [Pseudogemmobacter humi]VDC32652.1 hypothetical protein XINFAN_03405 [Pseudogemmobacter humi]